MLHPYRTQDCPPRGPSRAPSIVGLESALRAVTLAVLLWSFLRVAICTLRGLDLEGFVALFIIVTTVLSLTSRSRTT